MAQFTFVFGKIPSNVTELKSLPEADLRNGFKTVALVLLALMNFDKNPDASFEMVEFLNGPDPVSPYLKSFLKDRLNGKQYKVSSFFQGANRKNNYTPSYPLTITITSTPYSFTEENYGTVYVKSAGADEVRPMRVRKKPSTGEWFINEIGCLGDIKLPESEDVWA